MFSFFSSFPPSLLPSSLPSLPSLSLPSFVVIFPPSSNVYSAPVVWIHGHIRATLSWGNHTSVGFFWFFQLFLPAVMTWRTLDCCDFS